MAGARDTAEAARRSAEADRDAMARVALDKATADAARTVAAAETARGQAEAAT
jgi:hypothetical protein